MNAKPSLTPDDRGDKAALEFNGYAIVSIHPTNKNSLEQQQQDKLRRMLETILPGNDF